MPAEKNRFRNLLLALPLALGLLFFCVAGCEGAPQVPHSLENLTNDNCLTCHKNGTYGAPRTPHPKKTNCLSCHHPAGSPPGKQ